MVTRAPIQSIADLITQAWASLMADVHIAVPAAVQSYDYKTKKVSVQPLIKRTVFEGQDVVSWPVISDVPVEFPGSSTMVIQWPLAQGDTGLLVFCEQSIDAWLSGTGAEVDPQDTRRFNASDAVFRPGLGTFTAPGKVGTGSGLEILYKNGSIRIDDNGKIELNGTSDNVVMWSQLNTILQGFVTSLNTYLDGHVHSGVTTGPGASGPPSPAGLSLDLSAAKASDVEVA